jgi:four helix bundle protein
MVLSHTRPARNGFGIASTGSGTSVGANIFEADEAMSRPDFCRMLGIVIKELNETRFWLRLVVARKWIRATGWRASKPKP